MLNTRGSRLAAVAAVALLLTACGGGGGGGGGDGAGTEPDPPAPPPPPAPETFRISGTVTASPSQALDGDNNDRNNPVRPNDTIETAQAIANPITLGGYVNRPGTGAEGRSFAGGDIDDYFRVELLAGQSVTMLVADFQQADADLYLWDTRGNILDFSIESGELETLLIPRDGTYIVNAYAFAGATNYILAIGNQGTAGRPSAARHELVPWETVIRYREHADRTANPAGRGLSARLGLSQRGGGPGRPRLMGLRRGLLAGLAQHPDAGSARAKGEAIRDPELLARWETQQAIKALRRDPDIAYAEPNYRVRALATPDDEAYPLQWHYPLIELPAAWDSSTGDPGVVVAVIDTGVLGGHPDLQGQLVAGYDFIRDSGRARDGDGIDSDPEDPGDGQGGVASSFHGTHVSGTVAAAGDNGIGVAGVAYGARVMPLRVLGAGGGTSYDVEQAVRFAAGFANDSGSVPARRADIINLSLGGAPFSQSSQALYRQVRDAGVVVVAAAGNQGGTAPSYPAAYDGVISVSAVDAQRRRAAYSNLGPSIDIAAPGGDNSIDLTGDGYPDGVLSTGGSGGGDFVYSFLNGTSMAAPHVAGVLALMKSVNPELGPVDIDALLVRGELSDDLGPPGRDDSYGYGLINARRAVRAALEAAGGSADSGPLLTASAGTLNFSSTAEALQLELRNGGQGELTLLELTGSEAWLELTPLDVDGSGLGLYRVAVDRAGLEPGVYGADITARSTVNTQVVRVIMFVGGDTTDVGVIYILLLDADSGDPVDQAPVRAQEGRYRFVFDDVPAGRYRLAAGSDADNDLFICDAGEACGAWLTLDQPLELNLAADREGIDFPVDYLIAIPTLSADPSAAADGPAAIRRPGMQPRSGP